MQWALDRAATAILARQPWSSPAEPLVAGCFVAYSSGEAGPGHPGDRARAAAVLWRAPPIPSRIKRSDSVLRGTGSAPAPRQAADVSAQAVVAGEVPAAYAPGLLALREGPLLAAAVNALPYRPDIVMVDATGADHPRRAGLAVHLGAVLGLPSIGVTHRALLGHGPVPELRRGATAPVQVGGREVARWVRTRTGVRPVLAHGGWRTDAALAADVVLRSSTPASRTPVPLQEARRVAREARAGAGD
jgi:deoxyribonuclease V